MLMPMLSADLRILATEHIDQLAAEHRITVRRSKTWLTSEADIPTRQVFVAAKLRTATDYLASLHEIGHIVDRTARAHRDRQFTARRHERYREALVEEAAAWAWAVEHALPAMRRAMTQADWRRVGDAWLTYAVW